MADFLRCLQAVFGSDSATKYATSFIRQRVCGPQLVDLGWKGALQFLAFCGLPAGHSADKSVPLAIRRSPRSLVLEFLAAYAEGDGHLGTARIEIATASSRLAEEIQLLALNLGVVGRRSTINGYARLAFLGAEAARLARLLRPYLVTPRKRDAAAGLASVPADRRPNLDVIPGLVPALRSLLAGPNGWVRAANGELVQTGFGDLQPARATTSRTHGRGRSPASSTRSARLSPAMGGTIERVLDDEYLWDEVVTVADAGQALTYDFTVPDVHAFVANGIVSHNSGGKTRRAAKMVILDVGHPDILDFIDSKKLEEQKAWALIEQGYDPSFTGEAYGSVSFQNANHSVRVTDEFMHAVEADGDWTTHAVVGGAPMDTYRARDIFRRMADAAHLCGDPGIQYDTTINDWNPVSNSDRQYATNPCVTGDTLVATDEGWRSIESLVGERANVIGADGAAASGRPDLPDRHEARLRAQDAVRLPRPHHRRPQGRDAARRRRRQGPDDRTTGSSSRRPASGASSIAPRLAEAIGLAVGDGCLTWASEERARAPDGRPDHAPRRGGHPRGGRRRAQRAEASPQGGRLGRPQRRRPRVVRRDRLAAGLRIAAGRRAIHAVRGPRRGQHREALQAGRPRPRPRVARGVLRGLFTADGTVVDRARRASTSGWTRRRSSCWSRSSACSSPSASSRSSTRTAAAAASRRCSPTAAAAMKAYPVQEMHSLRITRTLAPRVRARDRLHGRQPEGRGARRPQRHGRDLQRRDDRRRRLGHAARRGGRLRPDRAGDQPFRRKRPRCSQLQ